MRTLTIVFVLLVATLAVAEADPEVGENIHYIFILYQCLNHKIFLELFRQPFSDIA